MVGVRATPRRGSVKAAAETAELSRKLGAGVARIKVRSPQYNRELRRARSNRIESDFRTNLRCFNSLT